MRCTVQGPGFRCTDAFRFPNHARRPYILGLARFCAEQDGFAVDETNVHQADMGGREMTLRTGVSRGVALRVQGAAGAASVGASVPFFPSDNGSEAFDRRLP